MTSVFQWNALPQIGAEPERWEHLRARLQAKIFLRSEGSDVALGTPLVAPQALTNQARVVVERFDRFSAALARAYFDHPELASEFLVNPLLARVIEIDRDVRYTTPASRFDCVLDADGQMHVIEHNTVSVVLYHFRNLFYLIRGLWNNGFEEDARRLDELTELTCAGFRRFYEATCPNPKPVATLGTLHPSGWFRAGQRLFRAAFERYGWRYVSGGPEHLRIDSQGVSLRGERLDVLWPDFLFYMAYQSERYQETKFPTKLGDFTDTPAIVQRLMADEQLLAHLRNRTVVMTSPGIAYLPLAKPLLSWVHRDEVPIADRDWLKSLVARTYSRHERARGVLTSERVIDDKDRYVIKPALYGGSHGVQLGCEARRDGWAAAIEKIWDDPSWAVQELAVPIRTSDGDWVSVGLMNYGGTFGGFVLRSSPAMTVNARQSKFIAAALPRASDP
jgi:hypothetical protein